MSPRDDLLADIEAFLTRSGMSATRSGNDAAADPRLVFDLRAKGARPAPAYDQVIRSSPRAPGATTGAAQAGIGGQTHAADHRRGHRRLQGRWS